MASTNARAQHEVDAIEVAGIEPLSEGDTSSIARHTSEQPRQYKPDTGQRKEPVLIPKPGGSWIERLRACKVQPPLTVAPDMARRLTRAGVPASIVAQLPPDFQSDPWLPKLVALPGVPYDRHEYLSTKMVFIALGEHGSANKAARLAKVMRALGWERCKLYPHLGFGRTVVRGFRRSVSPSKAGHPQDVTS